MFILETPDPASLHIRPEGDMDALSADQLRQALTPYLEEGRRHFTVDLSAAEYVTSTALGLFVELHKTAIQRAGSFKLVNCRPGVLTLLRHTKLDRILTGELPSPIQPTVAEEAEAVRGLMDREIVFSSQLNAVVERALRSQERDEIAFSILEGMMRACGSPRGAFYAVDREARGLDLCLLRGYRKGESSPPPTLPLAGGPMGAEGFQPEKIAFLETGPGAPARQAELLKALRMIRAIGVWVSGTRRPHGWILLEVSGRERSGLGALAPVLQVYANICGLALEKTYLLGLAERRNEELKETIEELQRHQRTLVDVGKLAALGAVISGLSHLMNNRLVPILAYTELLAAEPSLEERARQRLETVNQAAGELKEIIDRLAKVSRVQELSRQPLDLNGLIGTAVRMLDPQIRQSGAEIEQELADELPLVSGDRDLLLQAFVAILHRVCVRGPAPAASRVVRLTTRRAGTWVEIELDYEAQAETERLAEDWLDPMVPYAEIAEGRIFSFSIPRSVVQRHMGQFRVSTEHEGRTRILIRLPAARPDAPTGSDDPSRSPKAAERP